MLAALVNSGWLLILSLLVITGAIDRLATGSHQVHGLPVLIVSGIGAVVMLGGALILGGDAGNLDNDDSGDLNMRAILLDTAADAAAAAGVAIAGAVILVVGGLYFWTRPSPWLSQPSSLSERTRGGRGHDAVASPRAGPAQTGIPSR